MATTIHHGPPGSFKSFTLVQRIAIKELQAGRLIITNIRDFDNVDKVRAAFPELEFPESANIINFPDTIDGRYHIARFFHWAPPGALILIDEGQKVYPKRSDFKLKDLDAYKRPDGLVIQPLIGINGNPIPRPEDVYVAFDMQRHWNWDIYISTPNIDKLHDFIRQVSEWAYRHRSLDGVLPWFKDTWNEHQHDPEKDGKSPSHTAGVPVRYRADPRVYQCYSSTATGEHVKSKAGRSVFSDPKLRFIIIVFLLAISFSTFVLYRKLTRSPSPSVAATVPPSSPSNQVSNPSSSIPVQEHPSSNSNLDNRSNDNSKVSQDSSINDLVPFAAPMPVFSIYRIKDGNYTFIAFYDGRQYILSVSNLSYYGIAFERIDECNYIFTYKSGKKIESSCDQVHCASQYKTSEGVFYRSDCELMEDYLSRKRQARFASQHDSSNAHSAALDGVSATALFPVH